MAVLNGTKLGDFIIGTADSDLISGLDGNDTLFGLDGDDDTLDGGRGADLMDGGAGNDTYVVDSIGDLVRDSGGVGDGVGGIDKVMTGMSYSLSTLPDIE